MLKLNKDGTADLTLTANKRIKLRRPTLGEFRKLREQAWQVTDDANDRIEAVTAASSATSRAAERRAALHDADQALLDACGEWAVATLVTLGPDNTEIPAPDDLPSWAGSAGFPAQLLAHWRDVPLDSGGPPQTG